MGNPIGRERIYSTFFTQLSTALLSPTGSFNYGGRRPVPDTQLAEEQYPAFFLLETGEIYDRSVLFAPARVSLLCNLSIVTLQGEVPDETNVTNLNNLADAVESAIQNACGPTADLTLSGLVQDAWINHRQLIITGSYPQRQSKQNFGIEFVLPHSR
jgi:hypothetical protein